MKENDMFVDTETDGLDPKKDIMILGCAGAGKSTLASVIANRMENGMFICDLGLPPIPHEYLEPKTMLPVLVTQPVDPPKDFIDIANSAREELYGLRHGIKPLTMTSIDKNLIKPLPFISDEDIPNAHQAMLSCHKGRKKRKKRK